ncbi:hypothetical protein HMPREF3038_02139, partial [Akkermansia sp. KLE1797]
GRIGRIGRIGRAGIFLLNAMPWVREWGHRVFCDCLRGFSCLLPDKSDFPVSRRRVCC